MNMRDKATNIESVKASSYWYHAFDPEAGLNFFHSQIEKNHKFFNCRNPPYNG